MGPIQRERVIIQMSQITASKIRRDWNLSFLLEDVCGLVLLASITFGIGLWLNQFRDNPLPLLYETKEERIVSSSERLNASGTKPREETQLPADVTLAEFQKIVEERSVLVLDARPEIFHRLGHVPGALSLPREDFEASYPNLQARLQGKLDVPLVVYCSGVTCEDSELVRKGLVRLGHTRVAVFRGGWSAWSEAGLPEEKQ